MITAVDLDDAEQIVASTPTLSGLLVDWDTTTRQGNGNAEASRRSRRMRAMTPHRGLLDAAARDAIRELPIFLLADRSLIERCRKEILRLVNGYVWKLEDTPTFIANHIEEARREYLAPLLPPFFKALVGSRRRSHYSWHTPGHSGGTAFLKTPVGAAFHEFYGENTLRSDLSVSVGNWARCWTTPARSRTPRRGRAQLRCRPHLLRHQRYVDRQQDRLARLRAPRRRRVRRPQLPQVADARDHHDRRDAGVLHPPPQRARHHRPDPARRAHARDAARRIAANPLVPEGTRPAPLAVVTNSTYDGLCYDADVSSRALGDSTDRVHFDEAWYAYAQFHPLYANRHAMGSRAGREQPATFATQSTHKLLAAFSQASMIHVHDRRARRQPDRAQRGVHDAHLDLAAVRDDRLTGRRGANDGRPARNGLIDDAVEEALASAASSPRLPTNAPPTTGASTPGSPTTPSAADSNSATRALDAARRRGMAWLRARSATGTRCSTRSRSRS